MEAVNLGGFQLSCLCSIFFYLGLLESQLVFALPCQVVELLLQCRASVHGGDSRDICIGPLDAASRSEKWAAVRRLVELQADPNTGKSVLIQAVKSGEQDLVDFLCSNGASTNAMDEHMSASTAAAAANHPGVLKILAAARADLDREAWFSRNEKWNDPSKPSIFNILYYVTMLMYIYIYMYIILFQGIPPRLLHSQHPDSEGCLPSAGLEPQNVRRGPQRWGSALAS